MKKVLIDCDPSADDAIALMLALRSPELRIMGITAASGVCPAQLSARNVLKILALCGREEISVAVGAAQPLFRPLQFDGKYCGADGLSETGLPDGSGMPVSGPAALFLHRLLSGEAGVSIISIAPFTNIAALLQRFPEDAERIEAIYTISGSYGVRPEKQSWDPRPSWNVKADPEAAKLVLESGIPIYAAGLDVTFGLCNEMIEELLLKGNPENPCLRFLERAVSFNKKSGLQPYSLLVDSVGVAIALFPGIADYIHGKAAVETEGGLCLGQTLFGTKGYLQKLPSDVYAAYRFDYGRLTALLTERVFG